MVERKGQVPVSGLSSRTGHEIVYQMGTLRRGGNVGKDETLQ